MITADVARMLLVAAMAAPGMPPWRCGCSSGRDQPHSLRMALPFWEMSAWERCPDELFPTHGAESPLYNVLGYLPKYRQTFLKS
jgi:hypothetical protein